MLWILLKNLCNCLIERNAMVKILITGANGYIGHHVLKKAIKLTKDVSVVDVKFNENLQNIKQYKEDILAQCSSDNLHNKLGCPDVLIHLAWQDGFNHKSDAHLRNLTAHYEFIRNMINHGCKNIAIMGSMHEVGYWEGEINENTPCNPMSLYGIAKNALRQAVMTYCEDKDVSLKWLRAFYITGDDEHNKSIFTRILMLSEEGKKTFPFTDGKCKYDFQDIEILADQIIKASIQTQINGIINVCSGKPIALKDKVEEFIKEHNLNIKLEYGAFPDRPYDSPCEYGDPTKINQIIMK